jgi:MSHA biogenesis protein MshO
MRYARGFTLVELVLVAIIASVMAAVTAPVVLSSLRAYDTTLGDVIVLDKLRYATERLAREIREVNYNAVSKTFGFTNSLSAAPNSPVFTRGYYDSSGVVTSRTVTVGNAGGGTVTIAYSDLSATGAQVLTDEVSSLTFAYYDKNGASTTSTTNVRYVEISLALSHNGNAYSQRTRVELKNMER